LLLVRKRRRDHLFILHDKPLRPYSNCPLFGQRIEIFLLRKRELSLILSEHQIILRTRLAAQHESHLSFVKKTPMKTVLITLISAIAFTHAVHAKDWGWFHGDIGIVSPFVSSRSPTNNVTIPVVTKRKAVSKPSLTGRKSDSTGHRITAR
jgi:hypothetical protein